MEAVIIHEGRPDDCADIWSMLKQLNTSLGDADHFHCNIDTLRNYGFSRNPLFKSLIARRDGESIGLAIFFPLFSTLRGEAGVYLQDLWISPDSRNLSLGGRMMEQIVVTAINQWQATYLDLTVHGHNEDAERFYRRHGFGHSSTEKHLRLDGEAFQAFVKRATSAENS